MSDAHLPHILRELAEAAGLPAALKLAAQWGGQTLYIPTRVAEGHRLAQVLGIGPARALARLYGGERITVPLGPTGAMREARRAADRAIAEGASANEAARRSGLTTRTIYNRKARRREATASGQGRLFDD